MMRRKSDVSASKTRLEPLNLSSSPEKIRSKQAMYKSKSEDLERIVLALPDFTVLGIIGEGPLSTVYKI